jgi:hypothetical protein
MESTLDKEWVYLMLIAREMGLSKEQVREFIEREKGKEKLLYVKP